MDESGLCNHLITFSKEVRMRLTCMHKICEWPKPKNVGFPDRAYSLLFLRVREHMRTVECTALQSIVYLTRICTQAFDTCTLQQNAMHLLGYILHCTVDACATYTYNLRKVKKSGDVRLCEDPRVGIKMDHTSALSVVKD